MPRVIDRIVRQLSHIGAFLWDVGWRVGTFLWDVGRRVGAFFWDVGRRVGTFLWDRCKRVREFVRRKRPQLIASILVFLFILAYLWPSMFITIQSGENGVLFRRFLGGTVTDRVYGEGLHIIFPWDTMSVYNTRIQESHQTLDVLTKNGLMISLDFSVRYRPDRQVLGVLHRDVGPEYVEKVVKPEVSSVLRTEIGRLRAEEVFRTERAVLESLFDQSIENVLPSFVEIDALVIRSIRLPPTVQTAIEVKIEQQHLAEAYEFRLVGAQQEAKRKEIEALGFKAYNDTIAASITDDILRWRGIQATQEIATSENAKVIVVGTGPQGLPIILGGQN